MKRDELIESLSRDLQPVYPPVRTAVAAVLWLVTGWSIVTAITLATGPMRPGFVGQLLETPRFAIETLLGIATGLAAMVAALELSIPGRARGSRTDIPAFALLAIWIGLLAYGLYDPAIEPSRIGKRPHCFVEGIAFSIPTLLIGFALMRRHVVLNSLRTGVAAGIAAASLPAVMMSAACMYDPFHILTMHTGVIPIVALASAVAGRALWKRI